MRRKNRVRFYLLTLFLFTAFLLACPAQASAAPKNKLVTNSEGSFYYNKKGKIVKNRLVTVGKKTYYFGADGLMVKRTLFKYKGKTYFASASGAIVKNRLITYRGKKYYFDQNGRRKTGLVSDKKHSYYVTKAGELIRRQWKKVGKYYYHFNAKGYLDKNKWIDSYYADANGRRLSVQMPKPKKQKTYRKIRMTNIRQDPELPTGCESVALTMVLKFYKFKIGKTTIASQYLPTNGGGNFVTSFAGSPFSYSGAGIYAPGLKDTANKFLKAKKSSLRAYDISGISLKNLYRFLDNGTPVIVWNSMYMRDPVAVSSYRTLGKTWNFYRYEHCVVLCGYNTKTKKVLINDSLSGLVWRNAKSFERIYNKLGKMAVVIQ